MNVRPKMKACYAKELYNTSVYINLIDCDLFYTLCVRTERK